MGTCLPVYGKKQGEHCSRDTDCDSGFLCIDSGYGRSCQTPVPGDKGLGKLFFLKKNCRHAKISTEHSVKETEFFCRSDFTWNQRR